MVVDSESGVDGGGGWWLVGSGHREIAADCTLVLTLLPDIGPDPGRSCQN